MYATLCETWKHLWIPATLLKHVNTILRIRSEAPKKRVQMKLCFGLHMLHRAPFCVDFAQGHRQPVKYRRAYFGTSTHMKNT